MAVYPNGWFGWFLLGMGKMRHNTGYLWMLVLIVCSQTTYATIVGSKHDLSSATTTEICVFCHTPHNSNTDLDKDLVNDQLDANRPPAPLWNRNISTVSGVYTPYTSDTMNTDCDATPSPLSLACLSCHDSAAASGDVGAVNSSDAHQLKNEPNLGASWPRCDEACHDAGTPPRDLWQIGPNLSNDHPISMTYPTPSQDPDFHIPPNPMTGWSDVKLFNGRVECPTCHNPHDPSRVPFLRKTVSGSQLCIVCHNK